MRGLVPFGRIHRAKTVFAGPILPNDIVGLQAWYRADLGVGYGLSPVVATGTTPPAVTLTGTPLGVYSVEIDITTLGTRGIAIFKWSTDGGSTFTSGVLTAATVVLGATGITANFAAGTYAINNKYTSFTTAASWADQSGTGDANKNLIQATASAQPQVITADAAYNNRPAFGFNSIVGQTLKSGVWSSPINQPYTIVLVGNDDGTAAGQIYAAVGTSIYLFGNNGAGHYYISGGANLVTSGAASSAPRAVMSLCNTTTSSIFLSAKTADVTGTIGGNIALSSLAVGATGTPSAWLNGKIAEAIIYNSDIGATNRALVWTYLNSRYGITIGA